jgi:hypothetical protein
VACFKNGIFIVGFDGVDANIRPFYWKKIGRRQFRGHKSWVSAAILIMKNDSIV